MWPTVCSVRAGPESLPRLSEPDPEAGLPSHPKVRAPCRFLVQVLALSAFLVLYSLSVHLSVRQGWCHPPGSTSTSSRRGGIWCSRHAARWREAWSPTWTTVLSWLLTVTTAAFASRSRPLMARSEFSCCLFLHKLMWIWNISSI